MLVLSRKLNERILLPTLNVVIKVAGVKGRTVRLGIDAPKEVPVLREEIPDRNAEWSKNPTREADGTGQERNFPSQSLCHGLKNTATQLGLMRLQLDTGETEEAKTTLARLQQNFQLLCYGVEGEIEGAELTTPRCKPRKALLVEDNRNERELLAGFLRGSGLEVDTAGDGSDALDYLGSHGKPDVILLDMGLPGVDGPTVVRQLRGNPRYAGLKIIGVSGHLPDEFGLECGPRGIDGWFQKPLDPAALVHELAEELCNSRN
jgi:carbon storage regulator CsrA